MITSLKNFLFKNTSQKQTIIKNTLWLFLGNIFSRLIRAAILIYAARILGAVEFGAFSYALSIAAFFTIFSDFGINAVITREAVVEKESQVRYFSTALFLKTILILIIGLILIFIYPHLAPFLTSSLKDAKLVSTLVPLMALVIFFDTLRDFSSSLFRAWEKMEWESLIQILTNFVIAVSGFLAIKYLPSAKSLAIGYIIGTAVGMIIAFFPFRSYFKNLFHNFSFPLIKKIFQSSWIFAMMGLSGAIMLNTDIVMIGWLSSIKNVGYYSAGQKIAQLIYIIPALIASAFFPALSRNYQDKERLASLSQKEIHFLILLALPLSLGGIILSEKIILFLYGKEYLLGAVPFLLMSLTFLPVFISTVLGNIIFALKKEKILLKYTFLAVLGNIFFNLLFIPQLGIAGAALSTVFNQLISLFYLYFHLSKEFSVFPKIYWRKVFFALFILGIIIYLSIQVTNVIFTIFFGSIFYFLTLLLLKEELFSRIFIQDFLSFLKKKDEKKDF